MHIFLDTNVFYNNWHFRGANIQLLFNFIENSDAVLLISEIVQEESQNIRRRELKEAVSKLKSSIKKYQTYIASSISFDYKDADEPYDFKTLLQEKVENLEFIPYANVPHSTVIKRCLENIKPFQRNEKGYRDTLIWLSFLEYVKSRNVKGEVIFVTSNADDFFGKDGFNEDLLKDIEEAGLLCKITPYLHLYDCIAKIVDAAEHAFAYEYVNNNFIYPNERAIEDAIEEYLNALPKIRFKQLLGSTERFPGISRLINFTFGFIDGIEDPKLISYKKISDTELFIQFSCIMQNCYTEFTIPVGDYFFDLDLINARYYDILPADEVVNFTAYFRPQMEMTFTFNIKTNTVDGLEISALTILR